MMKMSEVKECMNVRDDEIQTDTLNIHVGPVTKKRGRKIDYFYPSVLGAKKNRLIDEN